VNLGSRVGRFLPERFHTAGSGGLPSLRYMPRSKIIPPLKLIPPPGDFADSGPTYPTVTLYLPCNYPVARPSGHRKLLPGRSADRHLPYSYPYNFYMLQCAYPALTLEHGLYMTFSRSLSRSLSRKSDTTYPRARHKQKIINIFL